MRIPLDSFEQYIPERVLRRGLKLVEASKVLNLAHLGGGQYSADVRDKDLLQPTLALAQAHVVATQCSCPEFEGGWCRHTAALVLAQQAGVLGMADEPKPLKKTKKAKTADEKKPKAAKPKKMDGKQEADWLLQSMQEAELRAFLVLAAKQNPALKSQLLLQYGHLLPDQSLAGIADAVKLSINDVLGRRRYVDPTEQRRVNKLIADLGELVTLLAMQQPGPRVQLVAAGVLLAIQQRTSSLAEEQLPEAKGLQKLYDAVITTLEAGPAWPSHEVAEALATVMPHLVDHHYTDHFAAHMQWLVAAAGDQLLPLLDQVEQPLADRQKARFQGVISQELQKLDEGLATAYQQSKAFSPVILARSLTKLLEKGDYAAAFDLAGKGLQKLPFTLDNADMLVLQNAYISAAIGSQRIDEALESARKHFLYLPNDLVAFFHLAKSLNLPSTELKRFKEGLIKIVTGSYQQDRYAALLGIYMADEDEEEVRLLVSQQDLIWPVSRLVQLPQLFKNNPSLYKMLTEGVVTYFFAKRRSDLYSLREVILEMLEVDEEGTLAFLEKNAPQFSKYAMAFQNIQALVNNFHQMG